MKLTSIILLSACLTASAKGGAQTVSLSLHNVSIEKAFAEIKKQTGYEFLYSTNLLDVAKPVNIEVKNATLEKVLELTFKNQSLTYSIVEKTIIVKPVTKSPNPSTSFRTSSEDNLPPPIDITGKVTDADGNPLVGANVRVKGTSIGTTTNNNGEFKLTGIPDNATLEISYVGYETYTVSLSSAGGGIRKADGGGLTIIASLKVKPESLNEVVINKGYYTEKQKLSVGNVGKVTAKDIENRPVNNPLLALEGRVPGVVITPANGLPGSGVVVRIQGQNSISRGNDPLYVIDGVPYSSQMLPTTALGSVLGNSGSLTLNGIQQNGLGNPLSYINSNEIESIEVLKDADATSIYGSRAANGAILITTKKGKAGHTKVDINMQTGWGKVTRMLDLLSTQQYLSVRREAFKNDNAAIGATNYDFTLWDTTRYTDWQKVLIGGTAKYDNISGNISGGNGTTQFSVGGAYNRQTTVFPGDFSDQKGSAHFNIRTTTANQRFKFELTGNYLIDDNQLMQVDKTIAAIQLAPDAPTLYNTDGSLNWAPTSTGTSSWTNPLDILYKKYQNKTNSLVSNAFLNYQVLRGLEVSSSFGYTNLQTDEFTPSPLVAVRPENRATTSRSASYTDSKINTWIVEPQISYSFTNKIGKIQMLVGSTIMQNTGQGTWLSGIGYNSDQTLKDIKSASSVVVSSTVDRLYKYNAFFGRVNYNWQDKLIINATARRDGSSRFGPENLFHNFGSVGVGWIFSSTKFIQKQLKFLSFGKIRGSYGTTGNDQIGDYQFMNLYSPISVGVPFQGAIGLTPNGHANPNLQWEETSKLQGGIDLGFFADRLYLTVNYFRNRSSNQLINYSLPLETGFISVTKNLPATIQNSGWEFSISYNGIQHRVFNWSSSLNLSAYKNKLLDFPNLTTSTYASTYIIGQPVTIAKVFRFAGVDPATGVYQYYKKDGTLTSNPNSSTDRIVVINRDPKFFGGFQNTFRYKGLQLDVFFQFVKQVGQNYLINNVVGEFGGGFRNQPVEILNHWQKPGDISNIQRYSQNFNLFLPSINLASSDYGNSDASYVRMKNISLSWQLPQPWLTKMHLKNLRLYTQGENLLTITKYKGMDPETRSTTSLPPLKILTVGVQLTL